MEATPWLTALERELTIDDATINIEQKQPWGAPQETGARIAHQFGGRVVEVFVVVREDQNDHGFVDTSVCGIYRTRADADACVVKGEADARAEGFRVSGDANPGWDESDWQVYYKIEAHELN